MDKIQIPTPQDRKIESTESDVASILFESMNDKLRIAQLENELGQALMEIMTIKMGGNA